MDTYSASGSFASADPPSSSGLRRQIERQINGLALFLTYGAILAIGGIVLAFRYPFMRPSRARHQS